jgi:hypothetical protein
MLKEKDEMMAKLEQLIKKSRSATETIYKTALETGRFFCAPLPALVSYLTFKY